MIRPRAGGGLISLAALLLLLSVIVGLRGASPVEAASSVPPNIILIQADDQALSHFSPRFMPHTFRHLVRKGTKFPDYIVATPQCCPSRASLFSGQYPHNDGVFSNRPGYPALNNPGDLLPDWLQAAGYRTAHFGKYLNGYSALEPAPGWDRWFTKRHSIRYYGYTVSSNGKARTFGNQNHDYITRVLTRESIQFIDHHVAGGPFYLQLDHTAPHNSGRPRGPCPLAPIPDPRDLGAFGGLRAPHPPSFNEADISEKPPFMQALRRLDRDTRSSIRLRYRCAAESMLGVDRSVDQIWRAVKSSGELDRTVFVYTSDNGFFYGEHRLKAGKVSPYDEAIRQPLVIRAPRRVLGSAQAASFAAPVANIDVAPTLAELAGVCQTQGSCPIMDGRSLVDPLRGDDTGFANRDLLVEFASRRPNQGVCSYEGIRAPGDILVDYRKVLDPQTGACTSSNVREHYSLDADPFELENLYPAEPGSPTDSEEQSLLNRLAQLEDCSGIAGRDPAPASGHYCD